MSGSGWTGQAVERVVVPSDGEVPGGTVTIIGPLPAWVGSEAGILFYWNWPQFAYLISIGNVALTRGQLRIRAMDMLNQMALDTQLLLEYDTVNKRSKVTIAPKGDIDSDGIPALNLFTVASTTAVPNTIEIGTASGDPTGTDIKVYGVSMGRGLQSIDFAAVDTAAFMAELVVLSPPSMTWRARRSYRVTITGRASSSVANNNVRFQLRRTNLAGAVIAVYGNMEIVNAGVIAPYTYSIIVSRTAATDLTQAIVLTAQAALANAQLRSAGVIPRVVTIEDVGSSDDWNVGVTI